MKINYKLIALTASVLATSFLADPVLAFDGYSLDVGKGNESSIYKLAAQDSLGDTISFLRDHNLDLYYELSVAQIIQKKYRNLDGQTHSITDFGITPAVRWRNSSGYGLYAEIGVGLNYMTEKFDNNGRVAGTQFQFGDHIGAGYKFANNVDLLLKFQHYSNADIEKPNPAINFVMLKLTYCF